jgi:DNA-binding MurR/RpiR family transcriptional regulator
VLIESPPSNVIDKWSGDVSENVQKRVDDMLEAMSGNTRKMIESFPIDVVNQAIDMILAARHVFLVGNRSSYCLTVFLNRHLSRLLGKCTLLESNNGELAEKILHAGPADLLIATSMPGISTTAPRGENVKTRGSKIIAITGGENPPFINIADVIISVPYKSGSFFRSMIPP